MHEVDSEELGMVALCDREGNVGWVVSLGAQ